MLAVETAPAPLLRKQSIFRRFTTRKERPLQISSPIIDEEPSMLAPLRRSTSEEPLDSISASPLTLPSLNTRPSPQQRPVKAHVRVDSVTSVELPISLQFSRPQPPSPARSQHSQRSSRSSTDSVSSTSSRVLRTAHTTSPFPHNTHIGPWNLFLPPMQVHALYTGFYPENISDEWFVFSEGPDVNGKLKVHFHRAWTGLKVAELFVVMDLKGGGAGKIVGIKWNGSEQTSRMVEDEAKRTVRGCCRDALGFQLEGEDFF